MTDTEKTRENRLRRMASRQLLVLEKSRARDTRAADFGNYRLLDRNNTVVLGSRASEFDATLDEIEIFLTKEELPKMKDFPTEDVILSMAKTWADLKGRGKDLSKFEKDPLLRYFPSVASGKLLPVVLLRYAGIGSILAMVANLSIEDQKRVASEDAKVSLLRHDGSIEDVPLFGMRVSEARQVLGDGSIRSPEEQREVMAPPPKPYSPRKKVAA